MLALALAAAAPLVLASDEKSWLHVPGVEEFRVQAISRTAHEADWPFAVDEGFLACAYVLGRPAVSFVEKLPDGDLSEPRAFILSTNPLDLAFAGASGAGLLKPTADLEALIRAVAPFQQAGERLCQQPQGTAVGPGETRTTEKTMLLIFCPYCEEERPELEFRHAGEAHVARSSDLLGETDEAFERFLYLRRNPKGVVFERWRHIHGCARFFNAARDTVTDKFLAFYKAGEPKPDLAQDANDPGPAAYANRPPAQLNVAEPAPGAGSGEG